MVELLQQLERKRAGYDEELVLHRFLLDAYGGTGGFSTKVQRHASDRFGASASAYSCGPAESYIQRYGEREDDAKYNARVNATTYDNYVEALTDIKTGYVLSKPMEYREQADPVADWRRNCDGVGTEYGEHAAALVLRAAILGWCPLLLDVTKGAPEGYRSRAHAREAGIQPYPVPLWPANLLDFKRGDHGEYLWAKVVTTRLDQAAWDAEPIEITEYTIWTREGWTKYEVNDKREARLVDEGTHNFGAVPIVIYRHKESPTDANGRPMHGAVSEAALDHLNTKSEFREHMRGQVFALLVHVTSGNTQEDINIGIWNALDLPADASQTHAFIAPPGTVAATFEKRLEAIVQGMYRMARVEFTRQSGGPQSGASRAYEFAQTNLALSAFAAELAKSEAEVDYLIGTWHGVAPEKLRAATVIPPTSFDVEDMAKDIEEAWSIIGADVGPTATKLIKMQVIDQRLPNLDPKTRAQIEQELDDADAQAEADKAARDEALAAAAQAAAQGGEPETESNAVPEGGNVSTDDDAEE